MATSGELATLFDVTDQTIRVWSDTFKEFLSQDATPASGETRIFNEEDIRVLWLVAELRRQHKPYSDIKDELAKGRRATLSQEEPIPEIGPGTSLAIPVEEMIRLVGEARGEARTLREERDRLLAKLEQAHGEKAELIARAAAVEARLEVLEELAQARERAAAAEARLEVHQERQEIPHSSTFTSPILGESDSLREQPAPEEKQEARRRGWLDRLLGR